MRGVVWFFFFWVNIILFIPSEVQNVELCGFRQCRLLLFFFYLFCKLSSVSSFSLITIQTIIMIIIKGTSPLKRFVQEDRPSHSRQKRPRIFFKSRILVLISFSFWNEFVLVFYFRSSDVFLKELAFAKQV